MRRIILILSLLVLAVAWLCWPRGERAVSPVAKSTAPASRAVAASAPTSPLATNQTVAAVKFNSSSTSATNPFPFRLANTAKTIGQLTGTAHAILLENALVDTDAKVDLSIPQHLQAGGEPGAFIVQARGVTGAAFRAALAAAGAEIVSYIPNNAYLVRLSAAGAAKLSANPQVQAVLPYAPYFKLSSAPLTMSQPKPASWSPFQNNPMVSKLTLLGLAVKQMPLPAGMDLTLGLFANGAPATKVAIEKLGGTIVSTDRSPFGQVVQVHPPTNWIALAQLPGVHRVEPARERKLANDLARVTLGIATDTITTANYLNLTGSNVVVEVNDTGVDINHPDFLGRVAYDNLGSVNDTDGHGTHVAGIIAGSGLESPTVTFAGGSLNPGSPFQYRGKAPAAQLYSVGFLGNDPLAITDSYLQEQPAKNHALISNNSWGYFDWAYDLHAASFDAAVRDAVPESTGPQPVLFVFAAGNEGGGNNDGSGGYYDSVRSPGTAKNVITVGALEQYRNITNVVTNVDNTTVQPWLGMTDSGTQVASFSSRGNVGVGTEGANGRFKPDVVAPGTMVVSTRSSTWDTNAYYYSGPFYHNYYAEFLVDTNVDNSASFYVAPNVMNITLNIAPNVFSPTPFPTLQIYVSATSPNINPADPATYDFTSINNTVNIPPAGGANYLQTIAANGGYLYLLVTDYTNTIPVDYDIYITTTTTNDNGNYNQVLEGLNNQLGPYYRYESGTSMATPAVSGTLALMQDFFTNTLHLTPSPALLKAMLINGARVTGGNVFAVNQAFNYQGWGLPYLPNSIPQNLTNAASSLYFLDQSPTNVLATGDSRTFIVAPGSTTQPLRITLAWTDPPGNPAAAVKLVNNLGLVVTNLTTGQIYYGNNFAANGNPPYCLPSSTNDAPLWDVINNVENVFIQPSLGASYSVTVIGRSVNVNAVTTVATNIVQDFALVMSLGDNSGSSLSVAPATAAPVSSAAPQVMYLTGTLNEFDDQMIGANDPLLSTNIISFGTNSGYATNAVLYIGQTNQWRFYVVSNTTPYTNFGFVTYYPNTLSVPRMGVFSTANYTLPEPNLDIYVATYPSDPDAASLTNLNPVVISNCVCGLNGDKAALSRGGQKFVTFHDSTNGYVYYIGVKCEDQTGGEYNLFSAISATPFSMLDQYGNQYVLGVGLPIAITNGYANGDNAHPGYGNVMGLAEFPMKVKRVVVTNTISTENYGDLYGFLDHNEVNVFLNMHDGLGSGDITQSYDDSGFGDGVGRHTDGPGATLTNYMGMDAVGPWPMTQIDDNYMQYGSVSGYVLKIEPHQPTNTLNQYYVGAQSWVYDYIEVPAGYTNLTIVGIDEDGYNGFEMYERFNALPTQTIYDNHVTINVPFGPGWFSNSISIGPPLAPGIYWVGIYNPDTVGHTIYMGGYLSYPPWAVTNVNFTSTGPVALLDDAVTTGTINVTDTDPIGALSVGLRVDHPRISDLVFHLVSPNGTRYLLMENRGNTSTNGCGLTTYVTNTIPVTSSGSAAPQSQTIDTGATSGNLTINYQMYTIPDEMTVYYQGVKIFDSGYISFGGTFIIPYGPGASTLVTIVMNEHTNPNPSTAWTYTVFARQALYDYLTFTENTNLTTTPIKYAPTPFVPALGTNLYYQAEQSLANLSGYSAYGTWQLEVLDNRTGATNPVPELLGWQLGLSYIKAYPYLLGFNGQGGQVAANDTVWYEIFVPSLANFATNLLVSATGPVNLWFSTNTPPTTPPSANDTELLASSTTGSIMLSTNTAPVLVPGGLYFLGVQNKNAGAVTYQLEVDFDHGNPIGSGGPASVKFKNIQINAKGALLQWTPAAGSHYQVQWKDNLIDSWNTISNPPTTMSNGVATFSDTDPSVTAPMGKQRFYRLVWVP